MVLTTRGSGRGNSKVRQLGIHHERCEDAEERCRRCLRSRRGVFESIWDAKEDLEVLVLVKL